MRIDPTAPALAKHYQTIITERLGLPATIDGDLDVVVPFAGSHLVLRNTAPDLCYLQMTGAWQLPHELGLEALKILATTLNERFKVAKVHAMPDASQVVVSAELFLAGPGQLPHPDLVAAVLPRVLTIVLEAAHEALQIALLEAGLNTSPS